MATWCYNTVHFSGDEQTIKEIDLLFNKMKRYEDQTREGQLPTFIESDEGHFHYISNEDSSVNYETKYRQNTDILVQIADHFEVNFLYEYYEPEMWIYGQATYQEGVLSDICIDPEQTEDVEYLGLEGYRFEGRSYETDMEIMELLLERKKNELDTRRHRR